MYVKTLSKPITSKCVCLPVPALQQTVPPGGVAVCPLSTVQYTCVADNSLVWREFGSPSGVTYSTVSGVNVSGINTGVFTTVLTDISGGNTLTSTATIDSVNLTDDGRNVSCHDISGTFNQQARTVRVASMIM